MRVVCLQLTNIKLTRCFCSSVFHAICIVCPPWIQLMCHYFELVGVAALILGGWNTSCIAKRLHWKKSSLCHFACFTAVPVCVLLIHILYYKGNCSTDVLLYCIEYKIILFLSHYYVFIISDVSNKSFASEGDIYSLSCAFWVWHFFLTFILFERFV